MTKDEAWINKNDLIANFGNISESIPNDQIRAEINQYFSGLIPIVDPTAAEIREAANRTILKFPELIDRYIRKKEDDGDRAVSTSLYKVKETQQFF